MTPDISAIAQKWADEVEKKHGNCCGDNIRANTDELADAFAESRAIQEFLAERERIQKAINCTEEEGVYEVPSDPGPTECNSLAEAVEAYVRIMNRGFEEDAKRIRDAEEATASLRAQQEQRWIPVSERLPEDGLPVLIASNSGIHQAALRDGWFYSRMGRSNYLYQPEVDVTHWMPLPAAPALAQESPLNGKEGK